MQDKASNNPLKNIKTLAYLVPVLTLILTFIFFVKTYVDVKNQVIQSMHIEADRIEKTFKENLNYTSYIMEILASQIKQNYQDPHYIYQILSKYRTNPNVSNILAWTYFFWIDNHFKMTTNSFEGILKNPIDESMTAHIVLSSMIPNKLLFGTELYGEISKRRVIPAVIGQVNKSGDYIGTLMVCFDVISIAERMKRALRNDYINFVIIDHRLKAIIKSQPIISKVGIKNDLIISHNLTNLIKRINFHSETSRQFSYIDMISGLNYYIKKIDKYPFIVLVNIDHNEIMNNITTKVIYKFIEISVLVSFFFLVVLSIYKRETWLRGEAEQATDIAIKATKAKTDFLAFTAHEIRSPLGFILTGSEIMKKQLFGPISEKYSEYVNGIYSNAFLILEFIGDLLDETDIVEGNFKITNTIVQIEEIVSKCVKTNKTRFNDRKVEIHEEFFPNLPKIICDERRIAQILNNLISNSIKYSEDKTIITITVKMLDRRMHIIVEDHGIGMSEEDIKKAFDNPGIIKRKNFNMIQSYGLGLPIVKKLTEAHNAELVIESIPNIGTKITIIIPAEKIIYVNKIQTI